MNLAQHRKATDFIKIARFRRANSVSLPVRFRMRPIWRGTGSPAGFQPWMTQSFRDICLRNRCGSERTPGTLEPGAPEFKKRRLPLATPVPCKERSASFSVEPSYRRLRNRLVVSLAIVLIDDVNNAMLFGQSQLWVDGNVQNLASRTVRLRQAYL